MTTRTTITVIGVAGAIIGTIVILLPPPPECSTMVMVECEARATTGAKSEMGRLGVTLEAGGYQTFQARAFECTDGGLILPALPDGFEVFNQSTCRTVQRSCVGELCTSFPTDGGIDKVVSRPHSCFCWQADAGHCLDVLLAPPPQGRNILRGNWAGPGCVRVPCGELYGEPSWPEGCN